MSAFHRGGRPRALTIPASKPGKPDLAAADAALAALPDRIARVALTGQRGPLAVAIEVRLAVDLVSEARQALNGNGKGSE